MGLACPFLQSFPCFTAHPLNFVWLTEIGKDFYLLLCRLGWEMIYIFKLSRVKFRWSKKWGRGQIMFEVYFKKSHLML